MRTTAASVGDRPGVSDEQGKVTCPCCGEALDLTRPDPRHAEMLLGLCPGCPSWTLIDARDGSVVDLIAVRLPARPPSSLRIARPLLARPDPALPRAAAL
ncbi:hypothetical protein [Tautonia plasticadhaerens]|uniref:Uncharacterized protein n=1 Tax=Tautonia plasticadhaerens TaxID=2527974 RepID=A0A518HES3_9BACT|nr:hypothetical protein [Tautonia plasticadhaerens]QDV39328.1 hypothetical protein ElP_72930 [Tautonia plasticadhaerens]